MSRGSDHITLGDFVNSQSGLSPEQVQALTDSISSRVVVPSAADWEAERHAWNLAVDQQPVAVIDVETAADVATVVAYAAAQGLTVSAQARGHGASVAIDGTILLRTLGLRTIEIDLAGGTATVGAGVRWGELNKALSGTGLSGLPGSSPDINVVGYTLGGGLSWFGRKYGFAANNVRRFELVNAQGTLVSVTRASDPDLFWALRGGGGEFGIVTAIELELFVVPEIFGGRLLWPIERAQEVLQAFTEVTRDAPDELTLWYWLFNLPDLPIVPELLRGRWMVAIDSTYIGTPAAATPLLAPLRAVPGCVADLIDVVPLAEITSIADEPVDPLPVQLESVVLRGLDGGAAEALLEVLAPGSPSPIALVEVRHLGGAFAQASEGHGAVQHIEDPYVAMAAGIVAVPELAAPIAGQLGAFRAAMAPYQGSRVVANFTEGETAERVYPADVLERLRAIKHQRDPHGVIRGNRPLS
ncbi:FAD-binding oxidoreductase [Kribbella sp. NPDC055071]